MKSIMQHKKLGNDQSGLVAIIVTMIIMFVLTITVISFATTSQRNARQALDRQLNTQAFYAAESGINDALTTIKTILAAGSPAGVPAKPDCGTNTSYNADNIIDSSRNVSYTCLLVDPSPRELVYDNVSDSHSQVIPIKADPAAAYVALNWNSPSYHPGTDTVSGCAASVPGSNQFPASAAWNCNVSGVLRIDIVDVGSGFDRNNSGFTKTFFIYPVANGSPVSTTDVSNRSGDILPGTCSSSMTPGCSFRMNLLPDHQYYLRIKPIYKTANLRIIAPDINDVKKPLTGAQATIDATGKAQDVLRRVQVRAPLTNSIDFPDSAIQTNNSICKTLTLSNNTVNFTGPTPDCDPHLKAIHEKFHGLASKDS